MGSLTGVNAGPGVTEFIKVIPRHDRGIKNPPPEFGTVVVRPSSVCRPAGILLAPGKRPGTGLASSETAGTRIPLADKAWVVLGRDVWLVGPLPVSGNTEDHVMLESLFVVGLLPCGVPMTVVHRRAIDANPRSFDLFVRGAEPG